MHETRRDTYFDVIEEWRQRYGDGHLEIRKMKIKEANLLYSWMLYLIKTMVKSVIYLLLNYQTGYIMWHSRLMIYIPFGCASGNIDPKPGMSHYIPCLIAELPFLISWGPSWSWIYNYLCNQCLSLLKLWVRTLFMARCAWNNIMW
jgi:hypothetical protein